MAIEQVVTAPRSPWQNAYVGRIIGSIRRECLDHVIILDERHLRRVLAAYFEYHHRSRTHLYSAKIAQSLGLYSRRLRVPLLPFHNSAACTIATSGAQPELLSAIDPVPPSRSRGVLGRPPSRRSEPSARCTKPAPQESGALVNAEYSWSRSSPPKRFHRPIAF